MKIKLKFAELHTPLFLAGTNFGVKLDNVRRPIDLIYDRKEKELILHYNGQIAIIPASNVATMTPTHPGEMAALYWPEQVHAKEQEHKQPQMAVPTPPIVKRSPGRQKAQVSTPTSHVFNEPK